MLVPNNVLQNFLPIFSSLAVYYLWKKWDKIPDAGFNTLFKTLKIKNGEGNAPLFNCNFWFWNYFNYITVFLLFRTISDGWELFSKSVGTRKMLPGLNEKETSELSQEETFLEQKKNVRNLRIL